MLLCLKVCSMSERQMDDLYNSNMVDKFWEHHETICSRVYPKGAPGSTGLLSEGVVYTTYSTSYSLAT